MYVVTTAIVQTIKPKVLKSKNPTGGVVANTNPVPKKNTPTPVTINPRGLISLLVLFF